MPFATIGILAVGELTGSEAELYAPGTGMVSVNVRLADEATTTATAVHLFVRKSGDSASYRVTGSAYTVAAGGHDTFPASDSIKLGPGDSLRGYAATAGKIHYVVEGGVAAAGV
jgi:hypothetical protein